MRGTDGSPDGELALALEASHNQQVPQVQDGYQQDQQPGCSKDQEGRSHLTHDYLIELAHGHRHARVSAPLTAVHLRHQTIELTACLLRSTAGPQPADEVQGSRRILPQEVRADRGERNPRTRPLRQIEIARGDPDDREGAVGNLEALAEDCRVSPVTSPPEALAD